MGRGVLFQSRMKLHGVRVLLGLVTKGFGICLILAIIGSAPVLSASGDADRNEIKGIVAEYHPETMTRDFIYRKWSVYQGRFRGEDSRKWKRWEKIADEAFTVELDQTLLEEIENGESSAKVEPGHVTRVLFLQNAYEALGLDCGEACGVAGSYLRSLRLDQATLDSPVADSPALLKSLVPSVDEEKGAVIRHCDGSGDAPAIMSYRTTGSERPQEEWVLFETSVNPFNGRVLQIRVLNGTLGASLMHSGQTARTLFKPFEVRECVHFLYPREAS